MNRGHQQARPTPEIGSTDTMFAALHADISAAKRIPNHRRENDVGAITSADSVETQSSREVS